MRSRECITNGRGELYGLKRGRSPDLEVPNDRDRKPYGMMRMEYYGGGGCNATKW